MDNRENSLTTLEEVQKKWSQEQIDTIRKTVAIGASREELNMFLSLAYSYSLDPFAHEIWFVSMNGRNTILTGRDGYLKIANCNPHYRGMQSDVVYTGDKFMKDEKGIHHAYNLANRGQIIGAYAQVFRDDRIIPAYFFAPMKDYCKNSGVWRQYSHSMIQKVAEAAALKRAFSISGLVTEEEVGFRETVTPEYSQQIRQSNPRSEIWNRYLTECDGDREKAIDLIKSIVGDKPSSEWTDEDLQQLSQYLESDVIEAVEKQEELENGD